MQSMKSKCGVEATLGLHRHYSSRLLTIQPKLMMAHCYVYFSIFLLSSLCVSGGMGSESNYSCDLQLLIMSSNIPLGDKHEGKLTDCIEIGWIESQKQYGLKTGESAECSKALSSKCQKTDQLTSSNDKIEFIKTIGNDAVGLKVNCTLDLDKAFIKPINVWECGDDVFHNHYILTSASLPQSNSISKRDVMASDSCDQERLTSCVAPLAGHMGKPGVFAVNKEQLIEICKVVQPALRCLSDVFKECTSSSGVNLEQMFSGVISTYKDLCDVDSQLSKDYLKYMPCMNEAKDRVVTCAKVKANDRFSSSDRSDSKKIICCALQFAVTCVKDVYYEHCGAEASELGYKLAKTAVVPIFQNNCVDSDGNIKCSGCKFQSMSVVIPLLSLATLFLLFKRINHV